ncbi:MAG TPA: cupin-like domain-containing protein [Cellvibrio sp.]
MNKVREWHGVTPEILHQQIIPSYRPAILKDAFSTWKIVAHSYLSPENFVNYLLNYDKGEQVGLFISNRAERGQILYKQDFQQFNFQKETLPFKEAMLRIFKACETGATYSAYMGSTLIEKCLPGLMQENINELLDAKISPRLWIGNQSVVQPHFDVSDNIAVVVAGRRRFTLFAPDQVSNLYVGPLDVTPAGQPMSIVPLLNPDLNKYPLYKAALDNALVAELEPGDAIFIPSLWWHGVQSLEKFNGLVNYWWNNSSIGVDSAYESMIHSILTISTLPEKERLAWRSFFDHYAFQIHGHPLEHLPESARGVLGEMTPEIYKAIKAYLYLRMGIK